ncbi:hypothetical protein LXL04_020339 [Taraxacum kok-saghyz]
MYGRFGFVDDAFKNANQSTTSILIFDDETRTITTPQFEKCIPFDPMAVKEAEGTGSKYPEYYNSKKAPLWVCWSGAPPFPVESPVAVICSWGCWWFLRDMDRFAPALTLLFLLLLLCCGGLFWFPCCCGSVFAGVFGVLASLPLFSIWCFAAVVLLFGWKNMLYSYYRCDIDTLM